MGDCLRLLIILSGLSLPITAPGCTWAPDHCPLLQRWCRNQVASKQGTGHSLLPPSKHRHSSLLWFWSCSPPANYFYTCTDIGIFTYLYFSHRYHISSGVNQFLNDDFFGHHLGRLDQLLLFFFLKMCLMKSNFLGSQFIYITCINLNLQGFFLFLVLQEAFKPLVYFFVRMNLVKTRQ